MLVNPVTKNDFVMDQILSIMGQGGEDKIYQQGIVISNSFSFGNKIVNNKNDYPNFDEQFDYGPYGVCDSIDQVLIRYKQWLNLPNRNFCISFTKVYKSEQPDTGGWRWHKWGEYIGDKDQKHEYLYEEDDSIQEVYCYHIYELL